MNYKCPCCGYYTYKEKPVSEYDICPVCFWEDDPFAYVDPDEAWDCNGVSLNEARKNFIAFKACKADVAGYVRPPLPSELTGKD